VMMNAKGLRETVPVSGFLRSITLNMGLINRF
jgi:hypothetical protein